MENFWRSLLLKLIFFFINYEHNFSATFIVPPPTLFVELNSMDYGFGGIEYLSITRHPFEPFKKIETIHVTASDEPLFINIRTWEQGVTYSIIPENELLVYLPYWAKYPKEVKSQLLSSYFIFNGTTATMNNVGSLADIYCANGEYRVKSLSIHVQEVLKDPTDGGFGRLLLLDSSRAEGYDSLFVTYPVNRHIIYYDNKDLPKAYVYISEHDDDEFVLASISSILWDIPGQRVEIYGGWPPVSNETLLATYTKENYESAVPQRFSGRVRTFLFHRVDLLEVVFSSFLFMKTIDKTGFIRTNWLDGSEVKTTILDTQESNSDYYYEDYTNTTKMSLVFTFSFRNGCVPTSRLNITTIVNEERQLYSYVYGTTEEMKFYAKDLIISLEGDAVVDYVLQNGLEERLFLFLLFILVLN